MPMSTVFVINYVPKSGEPSLGSVFVGYNKAYGGELEIAVVFTKLRITQTVYIEFLLRMLNWFPMNL